MQREPGDFSDRELHVVLRFPRGVGQGTLASFVTNTLADSKYVPVRVPHMHLADAPGHVSGRESDVQPGSQALSMDLVNVVHPDGHPRAFVGRFVPVWSKCGCVRPSATATLASLTKKDLASA